MVCFEGSNLLGAAIGRKFIWQMVRSLRHTLRVVLCVSYHSVSIQQRSEHAAIRIEMKYPIIIWIIIFFRQSSAVVCVFCVQGDTRYELSHA